jgi:hypothetical protein
VHSLARYGAIFKLRERGITFVPGSFQYHPSILPWLGSVSLENCRRWKEDWMRTLQSSAVRRLAEEPKGKNAAVFVVDFVLKSPLIWSPFLSALSLSLFLSCLIVTLLLLSFCFESFFLSFFPFLSLRFRLLYFIFFFSFFLPSSSLLCCFFQLNFLT